MQRNHTRIAMKFYGPAHTGSDAWVHFTEADIVHVGETWWNSVYPFIDYSTGGKPTAVYDPKWGQFLATTTRLCRLLLQHHFLPPS